MKGQKKFLDTLDAANLWGGHPESLRLKVRRGEIEPVDSTPPFVFERSVIEALPKPKVGRPKKEVRKNGEQNRASSRNQ